MIKNISGTELFVDESLVQDPQSAVGMATAIKVLDSRRKLIDHHLSLIETDKDPSLPFPATSLDGLTLRVQLTTDLIHQSAMEQRFVLEGVRTRLK